MSVFLGNFPFVVIFLVSHSIKVPSELYVEGAPKVGLEIHQIAPNDRGRMGDNEVI